MWNDFNGLIPIMVGLGIALGYDALFGFSIIELASHRLLRAILNPYTIVIAQSIAGIPVYSNSGIRIGMFVIFSAISILVDFPLRKEDQGGSVQEPDAGGEDQIPV